MATEYEHNLANNDLSAAPFLSVLIPAKDEAGNLTRVLDELIEHISAWSFEIIVIDDGSRDGTTEVLSALMADRPWLRLIRHVESCGKSAALSSGLQGAQGTLIVMLDGDGQNDPVYIPQLIEAVVAGGEGCGLAAGQRLQRYDGWAKKYGSKLANRVRGSLLKDKTRDTACGLKVIRREVYAKLPYFDTMHRFFPALVIREGSSVAHVDVVDRKRLHGTSKYGIWDRLRVGLPDLFGVWWLRRRRKKIPQPVEIERS